MEVKQALAKRKSVWAFLDKPVAPDIIGEILERAKTAPSGTNIQPWQWKVTVVTGETKNKICQKMYLVFFKGKAALVNSYRTSQEDNNTFVEYFVYA